MPALEGTMLLLEDGGRSVSFVIAGDALVITTNNVETIRVDHHGDRLTIGSQSVRIDGGARIELHADEVVRLDSGGSGVTFTGEVWSLYFPEDAVGFHRAPPEHPDTGGQTWVAEAGDRYTDHVAAYFARFPDAQP